MIFATIRIKRSVWLHRNLFDTQIVCKQTIYEVNNTISIILKENKVESMRFQMFQVLM